MAAAILVGSRARPFAKPEISCRSRQFALFPIAGTVEDDQREALFEEFGIFHGLERCIGLSLHASWA